MNRPLCRRCKGLLDIWYENVNLDEIWKEPDFKPTFICNNLAGQVTPLQNDEEFKRRWNALSNEEQLRLSEEIE